MGERKDPFGELEQLFDQLTEFGGAFTVDLPVDIIDREDELVVLADLPGRDPDSIDVALQNERGLRIEADEPADETDGRYITRERSREAVSRTVRLPSAVDDDETEASYEDGVLSVRLAKPTAESESTEIPVR